MHPHDPPTWKILTTLVPSDADTKKKGSLRFAAKLKLFDVTYQWWKGRGHVTEGARGAVYGQGRGRREFPCIT